MVNAVIAVSLGAMTLSSVSAHLALQIPFLIGTREQLTTSL